MKYLSIFPKFLVTNKDHILMNCCLLQLIDYLYRLFYPECRIKCITEIVEYSVVHSMMNGENKSPKNAGPLL